MGNSGSIVNMAYREGLNATISADPKVIEHADRLIFPGVGSFDFAVRRLKKTGLWELLDQQVRVLKKPILGVCLGMQLMTNGSEEGSEQGFGWIDADVKRFPEGALKVPHMGWNVVSRNVCSFEQLDIYERFYFAHSFGVHCNDLSDVMMYSNYGQQFVSGFHRDNIVGLQFHPEKSHSYGRDIMRRFGNDKLV